MIRRTILAMLLIVSPTLADPIPKDANTVKIKVWGELVDEAGGAKAEVANDILKLTVPGGPRRFLTIKSEEKIPHLLKSLRGNFSVQLTLVRHERWNANEKGNESETGYGLMALIDQKNRHAFGRIHAKDGSSHLVVRKIENNAYNMLTCEILPEQDKDKPIAIRLTRKDERLTYEYQHEAKWKYLFAIEDVRVDELKLGVYAEHENSGRTVAVFENYKITRPGLK